MPEMIEIGFPNSPINSLTLKIVATDELTSHGAPCGVNIANAFVAREIFHQHMGLVDGAINTTPDHINLLPDEIKLPSTFRARFGGQSDWHYPNERNNHVKSGGADHVSFDGIRREDMAVMSTKILRQLRQMDLITPGDYKNALSQLADHKLLAEAYEGPNRKAAVSGTLAPPIRPELSQDTSLYPRPA